ncbi:ATP-binding protein [Streptomyces sp. NBC_01381]|uniref:sensor histidine kinase n=1 Tax=Streptomyces sp. NBC_01381 TaxID=2903845 RepID=UPI0022510DDA|nr:ATP-binding protein [Streptomyces sp. NBC_01381]MCX4671863.1 ATP-binding protein [Streptomyces sp. NBC_01381]
MRSFPLTATHLTRARAAALLRPRRVRMRLTLLYGGLFVLSGAVLLTVTYLLVASSTGGPVLVSGYQESSESGEPPRRSRLIGDGQPASADRLTEGLRQQAARTHEEMMSRLLFESAIALAVTAVIAIWLGWVVAGRVLHPLRSMTTAIQQITARNVHERLAVDGPRDELKDLADTVDGLLGRLETALDSHRRFVANAAHELRTPLTLEHALLEESLIDGAPTVESFRSNFERLLAISKQQGRLLESLLFLATSERGLEQPEPLELAHLADEIVRTFRPAAERRGLRLVADVEPAALHGDPVLVERLLANLLDNAIDYNHPDGQVEITIGTRSGRAFVRVANTGPQVPADQVDRLFNPFQRMRRNADDGHHGLGLSIVRSIATAHDAELTAQDRPDGGLVVQVVFPAQRKLTGAATRAVTRKADKSK